MPYEKPVTAAGGTMFADPITGRTMDIQGAQERMLAQQAAGKTSLNIDNKVSMAGRTQIAETLGKGYGEFAENVYARSSETEKRLANIQRVNKLLDGINTGPMTENLNEWKATINQIVPGVVDMDKIASVEAARAEAGKLVMDILNEMKGAAQVEERKYIQDINVNTATTPEGRAKMEYVAGRQAERERKIKDFTVQASAAAERGEVTASEARSAVMDYERKVNEADRNSFNPPTFGGQKGPQGGLGTINTAVGLQQYIDSKGGEANLTPDEKAAIDSKLKTMGF
jgi:hypothetical protein